MENELKEILQYSEAEIILDTKKYLDFESFYLKNYNTENPQCLTCPGGFHSAYVHLQTQYYNLTNKIITKKMAAKNFKLKKDVSIYSNTLHSHYNDMNLTDEVATTLLNESEGNEQYFDVIPSNYKHKNKVEYSVKKESPKDKE